MAKKSNIEYLVFASENGTRKILKKTNSRKEAIKFYNEHPKAIGIQIIKGGTPAGVFQPKVPTRIKYRGVVYTRAFQGPHTKNFAESVVKDLKKRGLKAIARKYAKGWYVFVEK